MKPNFWSERQPRDTDLGNEVPSSMLTIELQTPTVSWGDSLLSESLSPAWPKASRSPRSFLGPPPPRPGVPHALTQALLVPTVILNFLFSYWLSHRLTQDGSRAQQMALHTLKMMANGGIRDHVGQVRGTGHSLKGAAGDRGVGGRGWGWPPPHVLPGTGFPPLLHGPPVAHPPL